MGDRDPYGDPLWMKIAVFLVLECICIAVAFALLFFQTRHRFGGFGGLNDWDPVQRAWTCLAVGGVAGIGAYFGLFKN